MKICFSQKPLGNFNQILYVQGYAVTDGAVASNNCGLIEQGQVVIPTGSMIKGSRPFYWILIKEANLYLYLRLQCHDSHYVY